MISWSEERLARAALGGLLGYGAGQVLSLAAEAGPVEAWRLIKQGQIGEARRSAMLAWAATINPETIAETTEQLGFRFVIPGDDEWPPSLGDLAVCNLKTNETVLGGAPVGLWLVGPGHLADWCHSAVAMVGARAASRYGESMAFRLASELVDASGSQGWTVISGGAFGIDAASHRGAMVANGRTVGVFAGGLDRPYPPGNSGLIEMIAENGLAISELPPGAHPTRPGFLARNRLIAALSAGTVVVEGGLRSGARNTANWAAMMGRVVMALPGPVTSVMSATPHRLIRDGEAVLVTDSNDIRALLEPIGQVPELPFADLARPGDDLTGDENVIHEALPGRGAMTISEVVLASGVPVTRSIKALQSLESKGLAQADSQGRWRIRRQPAST